MTSKNAVIYARNSVDRTGAGLGVAEQVKLGRELAERLGYTVTGTREDNDLTAFTSSARHKPRPGYEALLGDIRDGRADAVIAWHTDRLHRDLTELEKYIKVCGEGSDGVPTYTVQGGDLNLSTSNGRMLARILGSIARGEVEHMIERTLAAKQRSRDAGLRTGGGSPFGYRADGSASLVIVPAEAAAIRDACEKVLAGITPYAITREWNQSGLRTSRGANGWTRRTVTQVLLRASNAGLVEHRGEVAGKAAWEPIISEDTWRAVRAVLTDPARKPARGPQPAHLLTGSLICGVCGQGRFTVRVSKRAPDGSPLRVYACTYAIDRPGTDKNSRSGWHVSRSQDPLDAYAERIIIGRIREPDAVPALAGVPVDLAALDSRRGVLNAELNQIAAARFTWQQKEIQSAPLLDEIEQINGQVSRALSGSPLEDFAGGRDPQDVWDGLGIEKQRAVTAALLRIRVLPRRRGQPKGWSNQPGPRPFDLDAVQVEWQNPDGTA